MNQAAIVSNGTVELIVNSVHPILQIFDEEETKFFFFVSCKMCINKEITIVWRHLKKSMSFITSIFIYSVFSAVLLPIVGGFAAEEESWRFLFFSFFSFFLLSEDSELEESWRSFFLVVIDVMDVKVYIYIYIQYIHKDYNEALVFGKISRRTIYLKFINSWKLLHA